MTTQSIPCDVCGAQATLRENGLARRYECENPDCQHAIDARLVEDAETKSQPAIDARLIATVQTVSAAEDAAGMENAQ